MQPLCKHPYITAFLDIHYSALKKIRSQMTDSVAHLAIMMILLELASIVGGDDSILKKNNSYKYVTVFGVFALAILLLLDGVSAIGLHTPCLDWLLQNSLVKDRKNGTGQDRLTD